MNTRIKHIAFFKFKADRTHGQIAGIFRIIEDLPKQIPGILDLSWGVNTSTEGLSQGFTHSFVMLFESVAARDADLPHPVHQEAARPRGAAPGRRHRLRPRGMREGTTKRFKLARGYSVEIPVTVKAQGMNWFVVE